MQKTFAITLCAVVGAAASAHPFGDKWPAPGATPGPVLGPVAVVDSPIVLDEGFEDYAVGAGVTSMGGWELWPGGNDATVDDAQAASGAKSGDWATPLIDVVHQFSGITSGTVTFSAQTYMDSAAVDIIYYMIALNGYDGGGAGTNWSIQCQFDSFLGEVTAQFGGQFTTLVYDEWVEWRAEIDLDLDQVDLFYNGVEFGTDLSWTAGVSGGGALNFAAIDLYTDAAGSAGFWLDDVLIETGDAGGCYADCDLSGGLDFFDFLCFQNAFAVADPYADCDGSGALDFFDFLCFQNEFAMGCP